jgi:hypothetical protein
VFRLDRVILASRSLRFIHRSFSAVLPELIQFSPLLLHLFGRRQRQF